jgi:hypothetical protein
MYGMGLSYRFRDNLTLALDYESRVFSGKKIKWTYSTFSGDAPLSDNNANLNQLRLGGEYLLVLKDFVIPLRAGFQTWPTLDANIEEEKRVGSPTTTKYTDQVAGTGISLGTGLIFSQFAFDCSMTVIGMEQKMKTTNYNASNIIVNVTEDIYSYTQVQLIASVIVYF